MADDRNNQRSRRGAQHSSGHGLLTKAFLNIVNASNFQITYSELLNQLRATVTSDFSSLIAPSITSDLPQSQTPQLRGERNRMNQGFLQGFIDSRTSGSETMSNNRKTTYDHYRAPHVLGTW